jgi:isopropylmalate/homocitrate/citramalate synthase
MKKVEVSFRTNLMEQSLQNFYLENRIDANYFREIFPYSDIPKISFDQLQVPMHMPNKVWITDTTFRDGQQSMPPFTVEQILKIYDLLHKMDNNSGVIRQSEFFLYKEKDRIAVNKCLERGYTYPEVTSWIRATNSDLKLVKDMGIKETGILMSCSDYHIFKKLNLTRKEAIDKYLSIVIDALESGIRPRIHLEDITRADYFGFVIPFVNQLMQYSTEAGVPIKIRCCDTMGLGVPYTGTALPRSVQSIIHGFRYYCGVPSEWLEWHGHNDFYNVVANSTTAWLYGASAVNTTLFGIGERTGNCPLEAMIINYAQFTGSTHTMKLHVISEIAEYFEREIGYRIPPRTPFVGTDFNVTRAGIHADGMLKDEEIYNIFDTDKILNRPVVLAVNEYSGLAGIAAWINTFYRLSEENKVQKKDPRILPIKDWVENEYDNGRHTIIGNDELEILVKKYIPEILPVVREVAI